MKMVVLIAVVDKSIIHENINTVNTKNWIGLQAIALSP